MKQKHLLFPVDELSPGEMRSVTVDGMALVVVRKPDGSFSALRDRCGHLGARLSGGKLEPKVVGDHTGERALLRETCIIRCPWHGFEWDVDGGQCVADPEHRRVRVYPVAVEGENVVIER